MFRWSLPTEMGRRGTQSPASGAGSSPAARLGRRRAPSNAEPSQPGEQPPALRALQPGGKLHPRTCCISAEDPPAPLPQHPGVQLCPPSPAPGGSGGLSPPRPPPRAPPTPPMLGGARGPAPRPPARSILPQEGTPGPEKSARHLLTALHPRSQRDLGPGQGVLLSLSSLARGLGPFSCPELPARTSRGSKTHPAPGEAQPHGFLLCPGFWLVGFPFLPPLPQLI